MNLADLNQEQQDALTRSADEINAKGGNVTAQQLLTENGTNYADQRVEHYYQQALLRVGQLWRSKPYADRLALIAQLEA